MSTFARVAWPAVTVGSGVVALIAVLGDLGAPARPAMVCWFVLVCPGLAVVRPLRLGSLLWEWTLAVAVSMALAVVVGQVMLAIGGWSPPMGLVALLAVTAAGGTVELWQSRPMVERVS